MKTLLSLRPVMSSLGDEHMSSFSRGDGGGDCLPASRAWERV